MTDEKQVDRNELVSGKTYKVILEDCCITGEFVDAFARYERVESSEGLEDAALVFEHIKLETAERTAVSFFEV